MAYRDTVLADSPIIYLELEQTSGNPTNSGSETLSSVTVGSGVTKTAAGKYGNAWSFDGTANGYLSLQQSGNTTYTDKVFSFDMWVKTTSNNKILAYFNVAGATGKIQVDVNSTGKVVVSTWASGSVAAITSTTSVNNGAWHHIAWTTNGDSRKLYINGTQEGGTNTTAIGSFSPTSPVWYLGHNSSSALAFTVDEFAVYNSALTSTAITNRNATAVNGGYTAQAMTASGEAVNPTLSFTSNGGYAAQPMTASGLSPNAVGLGNIRTTGVTDDTYTNSASAGTNYGSGTVLNFGSGYRTYIKPPSDLAAGEAVVAATLHLKTAATAWNAGTMTIYRVNADWAEDTLTHSTAPSTTSVDSEAFSSGVGANTWVEIDITTALQGTSYGVALSHNASGTVNAYSSDATTEANRPYIEYTVASPASVNHSAGPLTASGEFINGVISIGDGALAPSMTADGSLVDPVVASVSHIEITPDAFPVDGVMPGGDFALEPNLAASPMTADGLVNDVSVEALQGVLHTADPMVGSVALRRPSELNGATFFETEDSDRYFQRVMSLDPLQYFRLNENAGEPYAVDRQGGLGLVYHGVIAGQHNGPDARHSVYFNGNAWAEQTEAASDEALLVGVSGGTIYVPATLEFSIRTSKANQFIMAGADRTTGVSLGGFMNAREVSLKDGKLRMTEYKQGVSQTYWDALAGTYRSLATTEVVREFSGAKNLADGEWHHIVIRTAFNTLRGSAGIEIWVDGVFDARRYDFTLGFGVPDFIGSRPQNVEYFALPALPSSQNFVGDMTELVFYDNLNMSSRDIANNYYAFMGYQPFEAEPLEATAVATDANGRGNQKRALFLYWTTGREDSADNPIDPVEYATDFNPAPYVLEGTGNFNRVFDLAGYKVFSKSVVNATASEAFYDPYTDERRLIDLTVDVDLDDYDLIFFKDWPDESREFDSLRNIFPNFTELYDRFVGQIRDASDQGISLHVGHYRLAIDLGIIDRAEWVPAQPDPVHRVGSIGFSYMYDYGSAYKFPWNLAGWQVGNYPFGAGNGEPVNRTQAFLRQKADYYGDTNKATDRYRVRANVPGLTDIPAYMIQEAVFATSGGDWADYEIAFKYLDATDGLDIGDEFIYAGTDLGVPGGDDFIARYFYRFFGAWATPVGHVLAGTVVTTFGAKYWYGEEEVDNPYRDYATTIVLEPGDSLKGQPVGGKIFVNFTEMPSSDFVGMARQDVNNPPSIPGLVAESAEQKSWDYSFTRLTQTQQLVGGSQLGIPVLNSSGQVIGYNIGSTFVTQPQAGGLPVVHHYEMFPIINVARIEMYARGFKWLADRPEVEPGSNNQRVTPATASTVMVQPTVTAQRSITVSAQPMVAVGQAPRVAEDEDGAVQVLPFAMTADAAITGYGTQVLPGPMTANAVIVDNFEMVHATGEQVVLYLYGDDIDLFMKEET